MNSRLRLALRSMAGDDPDLELEPNRDSRRFNSAYLDLESRTFRHSRRLRPSVVVDGASRADRYSRRFNSWQQSDPELAPARHSRRFNSSHLSDTSSIAELVEEVEANPPTEEPRQGDHDQYIKGLPLYALVAGLMMAAFLLMIDSTILVTVCMKRCSCCPWSLTENMARPSQVSQVPSTLSKISAGTVARICLQRQSPTLLTISCCLDRPSKRAHAETDVRCSYFLGKCMNSTTPRYVLYDTRVLDSR